MMSDGDRLAQSGRAKVELVQTEATFADLRAKLIEKWAATTLDHQATREKLYLAVQTLDAVKKALQRAVDDGKVLEHAAELAELLAPAGEDRRR